jgi:hypothetical protein
MINDALITFGGEFYPPVTNVVIMAGGSACYPGDSEFYRSWMEENI